MSRANRINLLSPLTPTECAARLAASVENPAWHRVNRAALSDSKPLSGRVSASELKLSRRITYRNSFHPCLIATLRPLAAGTVISGKVGWDPLVWLVLALFGYMAGSFLGALLFPSFGGILALALIGLGFVWYRYGPALESRETRFFSEFLMTTLEARAPG